MKRKKIEDFVRENLAVFESDGWYCVWVWIEGDTITAKKMSSSSFWDGIGTPPIIIPCYPPSSTMADRAENISAIVSDIVSAIEGMGEGMGQDRFFKRR